MEKDIHNQQIKELNEEQLKNVTGGKESINPESCKPASDCKAYDYETCKCTQTFTAEIGSEDK